MNPITHSSAMGPVGGSCNNGSSLTSSVLFKSKGLFKIKTFITTTKVYESDILAENRQAIIDELERTAHYTDIEYVNNDFPPCDDSNDNGKIVSKTISRQITQG